MIGQTISHYRILEKIGEGGMGIVYKAQDTRLDRLVALKFLPRHLSANEAEKARFLQEAKAASSLNHANVCTIYGIGEHDGEQFIEMEFVEGVTLRQKIPVEKMSMLVAYAVQIADALQEAHAKGIVHRDIKSDNIMINEKNQIKVMDFGLAKLKGTLKLTRTSSTVGTLSYMSPEQIRGEEVDNRSDIFSFAVVLFEMITGKLPFRGDHEAAMMYSIMNEEPEPVEKYKADISSEFLHVLHRGLEKDPAERYQSIQEMLIDLRRLQKQSTKVSRASMAAMPVPPGGTTVPPAEGKNVSWEITAGANKGNSLVRTSAALGVVIVLAVIFKVFFADHRVNGNPFSSVNVTRLTTSGKATISAISPDGRYVAYALSEGERASLWVRQVVTRSDVQIVPPATLTFRGASFSRDGNYIYYSCSSSEYPSGALFEIPVLGGTPRKLLTNFANSASVSDDGTSIAFIRQYSERGEEALLLANFDGTGERKVAAMRGDDFFVSGSGAGPSWSPDGKHIAISQGSNTGGQHINLMVYSTADGSLKPLMDMIWKDVGRIAWMPDGSGITFVAADQASERTHLWYASYPEGTVRSITSDLTLYGERSMGISSDGGTLVATNFERRSNIFLIKKKENARDTWDTKEARQLTSGVSTYDGLRGLIWIDERTVVYTMNTLAGAELWSQESDASHQRRFPLNVQSSYDPSISHDGKMLAFVSTRDTTPHIFRYDMEGGNIERVTNSEDYAPRFTADGKWLIYASWATGKELLYRVPVKGGDTVNLSQNPASSPFISPDGRRIACVYYDEAQRRWMNAILTIDGKLIRTIKLPYSAEFSSVRWYVDGKSISYVDTHDGVSNIWIVDEHGAGAKQITDFSSGLIFNYAWSEDGKSLALARGEETSDVVLISDASKSSKDR